MLSYNMSRSRNLSNGRIEAAAQQLRLKQPEVKLRCYPWVDCWDNSISINCDVRRGALVDHLA